jgi:hypothetical protein
MLSLKKLPIIVLPLAWVSTDLVHAQTARQVPTPAPVPTRTAQASSGHASGQYSVAASSDYLAPIVEAGGQAVAEPIAMYGPETSGHPAEYYCPASSTMRDRVYARKAQRVANLQASHWGYAHNSHTPPLGSNVTYALKAQAMHGVIESVTLYHYDFYAEDSVDGANLTPYGRERLRYISAKAGSIGTPIRIQAAVDNPALDQERRQQVIAMIEHEQLGLSPDAVVLLRFPRTNLGVESALGFNNRFQNFGMQAGQGGQQGGAGAQQRNTPQQGAGAGRNR